MSISLFCLRYFSSSIYPQKIILSWELPYLIQLHFSSIFLEQNIYHLKYYNSRFGIFSNIP